MKMSSLSRLSGTNSCAPPLAVALSALAWFWSVCCLASDLLLFLCELSAGRLVTFWIWWLCLQTFVRNTFRLWDSLLNRLRAWQSCLNQSCAADLCVFWREKYSELNNCSYLSGVARNSRRFLFHIVLGHSLTEKTGILVLAFFSLLPLLWEESQHVARHTNIFHQ